MDASKIVNIVLEANMATNAVSREIDKGAGQCELCAFLVGIM
jgi:hypothetical protein